MARYEGPVSMVGRLLLAAIYLWAGLHKILNPDGTVSYMTAYGLTVGTMILYLGATLIEIGGGLALALGAMTREAAIMLVAFMVLVTAIFHTHLSDPNQLIHFLKNTAMTGALLYVWAYGAGPLSQDARERRIIDVSIPPEAQATLSLLGRTLLALIFLVSGVNRILDPAGTQQYMAAMGLTTGTGIVFVSAVVLELGGALLLLLGRWIRVGAVMLTVFLIAATVIFHRTSMSFVIDAAVQDQQFHLMKNVAILGGLLYVWTYGAGRMSLDAAATARRAA